MRSYDFNTGIETATPPSTAVIPGALFNGGLINSKIQVNVVANTLEVTATRVSASHPITAVINIANAITAGDSEQVAVNPTNGLNITAPNGATLGFSDGVQGTVYAYYVRKGDGTIVVAMAGSLLDENKTHAMVAIGTGSDTYNVLYGPSSESGVTIKLIGVAVLTQATAGVWATAPSFVATAVAASSVGGMLNPMTAVGDLIIGGTAGAPARLAAGTDTHVLTLVGGVPAWQAAAFTNPMTNNGDMIYRASGVPTRLALGTAGQFLRVNSGATAPAWETFYSNGTWTPTVAGGTSPGTPTYDYQNGRYSKIGRDWHCEGHLRWTAMSGGSGDLVIGGLPGTLSNIGGNGIYSSGSIGFTTLGTDLGLWGNDGTTTLKLAIMASSSYTYRSITSSGIIGLNIFFSE